MYSREETKKIKASFWTTFGHYMKPVPGAGGGKTNWINYRTGIKDLFFRMDADQKQAVIEIQITDPDDGMRRLLFDQFIEYRSLLHNVLNEHWDWRVENQDRFGKPYASIGTQCSGYNIFRKEDWPEFIAFFKPRIILLDEFWTDVNAGFHAFK